MKTARDILDELRIKQRPGRAGSFVTTCPQCGASVRSAPQRRHGNIDWCAKCYRKHTKRIHNKRRPSRASGLPRKKKPMPVVVQCRTCGEIKSKSEFWKSSGTERPQTECKSCMRCRNTKWLRDNKERRRPKNMKAVNKRRQFSYEKYALGRVRHRAKKAGMEFTLTLADIVIPKRCPVLGVKLVATTGTNAARGIATRDLWPSIDRIDNKKGYTPDNIIVVSFRANRLKSDSNPAELRRLADFYESLNRRRAQRSNRSRLHSDDLFRESHVQMPDLQPLTPSPQQENEMPVRQI